MGLLGGLFSIVGTALSGIVQVGSAIAKAVPSVVEAAVKAARSIVDEVAKVADQLFQEPPKSASERRERELQEINEEIQHLRKKYQDRGSLSKRDRQAWERLKQQRQEINEQLAGFDQISTADTIVKEEKSYQATKIADDTAHILQFHVGRSTYNKICSCGRPMILQWNRELKTPGIQDFFWGCSGWYIVDSKGQHACGYRVPLVDDELNIFANLNRSDFQIKSAELTRKTLDPKRANRVRQALDSIRVEHRKRRLGISIYRCPIHGESLRLQRKGKTNNGLLDEYFLGCPRWQPDNQGCNFIIKLKSAGQISSVLTAEHQQGILEAVE